MSKIAGALMLCFLVSVIVGFFTDAEGKDYLCIFIGIVFLVSWVALSLTLILS